jgi:hypothetical protein
MQSFVENLSSHTFFKGKYGLTVILFLIFFLVSLPGSAQDRCGTVELEEIRIRKGLRPYTDAQFEEWIRRKTEEQRNIPQAFSSARTQAGPFVIPVVVHVVHNGEDIGTAANISNAQIFSQIDVLNEDFKRLNADTVNTPPEFRGIAGSMNLQFVLAKRDPVGQASNGIVRVQGSRTSYNISQLDLLRAESFWPSEDYLNIWVANLSPASNLGFAQFPDINLPGLENEPRENRLTDGIIVNYRVFGSKDKGNFNLINNFDKGRTATHEMGHYFGLKHIWGDADNCTASDFVADTPFQFGATRGCPLHPRESCESLDMFQNYMDYTNDPCMNIFTSGQVERMMIVLQNAPRRQSLLNSLGTIAPDENVFDIAISGIARPSFISCNPSFQPIVSIQNRGTEPIEGYELSYALDNGQTAMISFSDDILMPGEIRQISFDQVNLTQGQYIISFEAQMLQSVVDINPINNVQNRLFAIDNSREIIPYRQDFTEASIQSAGWRVLNFNGLTTWQATEVPRIQPGNRAAVLNFYDYPNLGAEDWLISPVLDFSQSIDVTLQFFVSYARNTPFSDGLQVLVSRDCGETFDFPVYDKSGAELAVTNATGPWIPSGERDWRRERIDLTSYAGDSDVRLAFAGRNGFGNNLYIDGIEFFLEQAQNIVNIPRDQVLLFPNPSNDKFFRLAFNNQRRQSVQVNIFDSTGRIIYQSDFENTLNQAYRFDLPSASQGLYLVQVLAEDYNTVKRLVVY